jgi:hypothetical protein
MANIAMLAIFVFPRLYAKVLSMLYIYVAVIFPWPGQE